MTAQSTDNDVRDASMRKRRQKKWTPRTRTGCISCRRRHIKCDEGKPSCANCTAQGIACVHGTAFMLWQARQLNPAVVHQPNQALTPFLEIPSFQDRQLFYFFRQIFVLTASTVFDAEFWSPSSLLACQRYPAAWHAALATAAFFRQTQRRHEAESHDSSDSDRVLHQWLQDEDERYELEHCNKAMRCLIGLDLSAVSYANQEMVLITSLLLTCYYRLRANPTGALIQVRNGLNLISQWDRWQCTTDKQGDAYLPNCVASVFWIWYPLCDTIWKYTTRCCTYPKLPEC